MHFNVRSPLLHLPAVPQCLTSSYCRTRYDALVKPMHSLTYDSTPPVNLLLFNILQTHYDALDKGSAVPLSLYYDVIHVTKLLCLLLLLLLLFLYPADALLCSAAVLV
jgi:hypothetical protein